MYKYHNGLKWLKPLIQVDEPSQRLSHFGVINTDEEYTSRGTDLAQGLEPLKNCMKRALFPTWLNGSRMANQPTIHPCHPKSSSSSSGNDQRHLPSLNPSLLVTICKAALARLIVAGECSLALT